MNRAKYIIIDTETTGFWPAKNGLMEFAAAVLDTELNIIETICFDIKPPDAVEVEDESLKITGFTKKRIQKGLSYEKSADKIIRFISRHFITTSPVFIAQFYPFDYAFLVDLFISTGKSKELSQFMSNKFIDTKAFVMMLNLRAELKNQDIPFPSTSISARGGLKDKFGISNSDYPAHTALGDVLATHAILLQLTQLSDI